MGKRILLGMLTPSSNTVLEPLTSAMVAGLAAVSVHYSRFPVTEIALSESALGQFDDAPLLAAAALLADAHVDIIINYELPEDEYVEKFTNFLYRYQAVIKCGKKFSLKRGQIGDKVGNSDLNRPVF